MTSDQIKKGRERAPHRSLLFACGIAAGARPVLNTLVEEVSKEQLTQTVSVEQTGCIYAQCPCGYLHASVFSDVIMRRPQDFSECAIGEKCRMRRNFMP